MFSDNFTAHIIIFPSNSSLSALNIVLPDSRSSDTYMQFIQHVKVLDELIIHYDSMLHMAYNQIQLPSEYNSQSSQE